jgi:hypothetical protein
MGSRPDALQEPQGSQGDDLPRQYFNGRGVIAICSPTMSTLVKLQRRGVKLPECRPGGFCGRTHASQNHEHEQNQADEDCRALLH